MRPIDAAWFRQMQAARLSVGLPGETRASRAAERTTITGPSFIDYFNQPQTPASQVTPTPAPAGTTTPAATTPAPATTATTPASSTPAPTTQTAAASTSDGEPSGGLWQMVDGLGFKLSNASLGPGPAFMGNLDAGPGFRLTIPTLGPSADESSGADPSSTPSGDWVQVANLGFTLSDPSLGPGPAFTGNLDAGPGFRLTIPTLGSGPSDDPSADPAQTDSGLWRVATGLGFTLSDPSLGPGPAFMGNMDAGPGWRLTIPTLGASADDSSSIDLNA